MKNNIDPNETCYLESFLSYNYYVDRKTNEETINKSKEKIINIGFIGKRGSGKSTLINTLRGLYPSDERAVKIDVIDGTIKPTAFAHPENEHVVLWDFPGIDANVSVNSYLNQIQKLSPKIKYDCFIICCGDALAESGLELVKKLNEKGINYYYVLTKVDMHADAYQTMLNRFLTQIDEIRLIVKLKRNLYDKMPENKLFALSALMRKVDNKDHRDRFEFAKFQNEILENLTQRERKNAAILAWVDSNKQSILAKVNACNRGILWASMLSGLFGIFWIFIWFEFGLLNDEFNMYMKTFQINEDNFKQLADSFGIEYQNLKRDVLDKNSLTNSDNTLSVRFKRAYRKEGTKIYYFIICWALLMYSIKELAIMNPFITKINFEFLVLSAAPIASLLSTYISLHYILKNIHKTLNNAFDYCKNKSEK